MGLTWVGPTGPATGAATKNRPEPVQLEVELEPEYLRIGTAPRRDHRYRYRDFPWTDAEKRAGRRGVSRARDALAAALRKNSNS